MGVSMSDEIELPDEVDESERGAWDAYLSLGFDASFSQMGRWKWIEPI